MPNIQPLFSYVMVIRLIRIDHKLRKICDKLHGLMQNIRYRQIICVFIIRIKRQHAARKRVHNILVRSLHHNIAYKVTGQLSAIRKQRIKAFQLCGIRKFSKQQKINRFLKPKPFVLEKPFNNIIYVNASVIKFTETRNAFSVYNF